MLGCLLPVSPTGTGQAQAPTILEDKVPATLEDQIPAFEVPNVQEDKVPAVLEDEIPTVLEDKVPSVSEGKVPVIREDQEVAPARYRVLVMVPVGSRSLYLLCRSLSAALGDAGHSVTLVSTFPASMKHENVKEVHTGGDNSAMDTPNIFSINNDKVQMINMMQNASISIGRKMWSNEAIKQLWRDRNNFHAIVIISYINEIAVPFLLDYEGAYINFCTPGVEFQHLAQQGNWVPMSVLPSIIHPFTNDMSFLERAINLPTEIMRMIGLNFWRYHSMQMFLEEFFPGFPPLASLYHNSSVALINGHFALDGSVPLLPTQVEVGTINAKPARPLPQDLEEFLAGAGEAGVILFSLGSLVKSADMPPHLKAALVEGFGRVRQHVVWKYEGDDLNLPPNVITRKWLPQQDILGHNQTRVFMSHCGNLGMQEAQYHGVPVLAVPVFFDQVRNAARMERKGYAVMLNWNDLTADSLVDAITTLTSDPRYQQRLSLVSQSVKDQKESPGERAVWWIEYAIRHKGSPHLEYSGRRLHLFQYLMLDVLLFWFVVFSSLIFLVICCLRKYCRSRSTGKHKSD